jgi:tetratricopeptide (TPR) repeat protein
MHTRRLTLVLLLLASVVSSGGAQEPRLGTIYFPTSGSPVAQQHFVRGVLYLHSFEYEDARDAFRTAQELEPGFIMAYWGEAMTRNHPVWNRRYRSEALAGLTRLGRTTEERLATAPTERERLYLLAVETLFAEGPKAGRDTAYMYAMQDLMLRYPEDMEAQAFYALSLLGLNQGVRDYGAYMKAGALAGDLFRINPDHPGAAHYTIHSFDDAIHAPLGLRAAWAYSDIAPAAPHAQHMTSHIFLALGMWDQVVARNETAVENTHRGPGHYSAWLVYGLLQEGRYRDAVDVLVAAWANMPSDSRPGTRAYLARMRAHYLVNSERWNDQVTTWDIPLADASPSARAIDAFALGYSALEIGKRETAAHFLRELESLAAEADSGETPNARALPEILRLQLEAVLWVDGNRLDAAVLNVRKAARLEDGLPLEFGPPDIVKPSHELLGELLLEMGRPTEAVRAFEAALRLAPRRSLSLLGLSRAAEAAGAYAAAARAQARLDLAWSDADAEARARLARD